jgi:hypothetical protein
MSIIPSQQRPVIDLTADRDAHTCFPRMQKSKPKVTDTRTIGEKLGDPNALLAEALKR